MRYHHGLSYYASVTSQHGASMINNILQLCEVYSETYSQELARVVFIYFIYLTVCYFTILFWCKIQVIHCYCDVYFLSCLAITSHQHTLAHTYSKMFYFLHQLKVEHYEAICPLQRRSITCM